MQFQNEIRGEFEKNARANLQDVQEKLSQITVADGKDASVSKFRDNRLQEILFGMFDGVQHFLYEDLRTLSYPSFLNSAYGREAKKLIMAETDQ